MLRSAWRIGEREARALATELTFDTPLRFRCLEGCGLCCTYQVPVLAGESAFLGCYGEAVTRGDTEGARIAPNVAGYLRRENGACVFLNEEKRCTIYADRPIYCRLFPLIRDSYAHRQIDANFSCPGLGAGEPFTESDFEAVAKLEATAADLAGWERRQRESYDFAVQMLRAKGAYCPEEVMRRALAELLSAGLSAGSLEFGGHLHRAVEASRPALTGCGNLAAPAQLNELLSASALSMLRYSPAALEQKAMLSAAESELLLGYLMSWVRRNLTLRAAHAQALASLLSENVARRKRTASPRRFGRSKRLSGLGTCQRGFRMPCEAAGLQLGRKNHQTTGAELKPSPSRRQRTLPCRSARQRRARRKRTASPRRFGRSKRLSGLGTCQRGFRMPCEAAGLQLGRKNHQTTGAELKPSPSTRQTRPQLQTADETSTPDGRGDVNRNLAAAYVK